MNLVERVKRSQNKHEIALLIMIVAISLIISLFNRSFFSLQNLFDILKSSGMLAVMAIGVTLVMISGGIDVSFPAIAAVAMHVTVTTMNNHQGSLLYAFLMASAIGIGLGAINAVFVSLFKLPTLIVTLATSNIYFGILLETVDRTHISVIPEFFNQFGRGFVFTMNSDGAAPIGLSFIAAATILLFILFWLFMRYTSIGRNIYAMGGSKESAQRAGISVWKTQLVVYILAGFLAGASSILSVALIGYVNPFNVNAVTMDVIAAVVLGGVSLTGGNGSVFGALLGIILLFIIRNSLVILGVPSTWDSIIVGAVVIISIALAAKATRSRS
jgi:simple sugar transport system permease protein